MSKGTVPTHAGDDSDGKIWGIEGMNILFLLAGLLLSIGLTLMLSRHHAPAFSVGVGAVPFALLAAYVLLLRQGKPKSFDTDLPREQLERKFLLRKMNDDEQKQGYTNKVKARLAKPEQADLVQSMKSTISPNMSPERQEQALVIGAKNHIRNSGIKLG